MSYKVNLTKHPRIENGLIADIMKGDTVVESESFASSAFRDKNYLNFLTWKEKMEKVYNVQLSESSTSLRTTLS